MKKQTRIHSPLLTTAVLVPTGVAALCMVICALMQIAVWQRLPTILASCGKAGVLLMLCIGLASCSRSPQLTVTNKSGKALTHVVVSGSGFSKDLGSLAPNDESRISITPSGESGLRVTFEADGKSFSASPDCYFENSPQYKVTATVTPDFNVKVDASIHTF